MSVKLREKKLKNKGKSFYLDIYHNGERSYEFLGISINKTDKPDQKKEKQAVADSIRSQREIDLIADGTVYTPKHRQTVDFLAYYESYLNGYDKRDKRMIRYSFEKFQSFLIDKKLLQNSSKFKASQLNKNLCEEFRDYLKSTKAGLTGETPQNYFSRFKKVLKDATSKGIFKESPASGVIFSNKGENENEKLKKNVLTADELKVLFNTNCGNAEVKRAFLFACFTGLGIAELRNLKWSNIQNNRLVTNREKTGIKVDILLSDTAIHLIGSKGKAPQQVFDLKLSDQAISKDLKAWVTKAEIEKNISFYCGRHTYAVLLLQDGANLKTVSDAMGQKSTRHTVKYLNHVNSLKDKATSNLPSLI
jgi:integrase